MSFWRGYTGGSISVCLGECYTSGMQIIVSIAEIIGGAGTIVAVVSLIVELRKVSVERKLECSSKISAWIDHERSSTKKERVIICNSSSVPIYDVVVSVDLYGDSLELMKKGNECCKYITCVPPGRFSVALPYDGGGMHMKFGASITFRDHKGKYWTRLSSGRLVEHEKVFVVNNGIRLGKNNWQSFEVRGLILPCDEASITKIVDN